MLVLDDDPRWDDYLKAIGTVCMVWADLDFNIHEAIWELANVENNVGACITAQIVPPLSRFRALIALVHFRGGDEKLVKALNKLSLTVDGLARQRNRIVHDSWTMAKTV